MANPSSSERFDFLKVLWNPSGSQIIAYASQIWDDIRGKKQTVINTEVQNDLTRVEKLAKIAMIM